MFCLKKIKIISLGLCVFLLSIFIVSCNSKDEPKNYGVDNEVIKIGSVLALSGPASTIGHPQEKMIKLAADEINQRGGIGGHKLEVVWQDGKCSPKESLAAAQYLVNIEGVKIIIGGSCSGETLGVADFVEQNKIIWLSPSSTSRKVSQAGDYIFRTCPSDKDSSYKTAELVKEMYDELVIVSGSTDFSRDWAESFEEHFSDLGGKILASEFYNNINETDFKTQILKVTGYLPQTILLTPQSPPEACLLTKQVRQINDKIPLVGNQIFTMGVARQTCHEALEGMIAAQFKYDVDSIKTRGVLDKYKSIYGEPCLVEDQSLTAYDAVYLVKEALEKCGDDNECIKEFLYSVEGWQGVSGTITMDENGDAKKDFVLKKIEGGELVSF